jgi:hypothetical protein
MTAQTIIQFRRAERTALILAVAAAMLAAIFGWLAPDGIVPAWRLAAFMCLQPALGSMIFILIHRLTGGQWARELTPFLLAGARLLPWIWLLIIPLLWFPIVGNPTDAALGHDAVTPATATASSPTPDASAALAKAFSTASSRHMDDRLHSYFSRPMLVTRAVVYAIAFFLLALGAAPAMRATTSMRWFGPLGLIGMVFLLHLLATDWFALLDPGWYSTAFPLVWISAQAIAGLAAAIAAAIGFGAEPSELGDSKHVRGIDWGNLMLAAIMIWTYVAFVELLIIWSGNLPAETAWYRHRVIGVWRWLSIAIVVIEFGAPFFLLLSRRVKKRRRGLGLITLLLLVGQFGYTTWLIAPAFPGASVGAPWLMLTLAAAALALFLNRYLAAARSATVALNV